MKLVRYESQGGAKPGILDDQAQLRDLSGIIPNIDPGSLSQAGLADLRKVDLQTLPLVSGNPRLLTPLTGIGKFIGIGLNYADHALESNLPIPSEPVLFMKAITCISGPNDPIILPPGSVKTDWEVELGVVIGTRAQYVREEDALDHVAGYCVVNDVSEREYQLERGNQWDKGKGCDSFGPIGPYLVTSDEVSDPQALSLWLDVNGIRRQTGNTSTMIFTIAHLVSYVSQFMTLEPGDVITTGTPPGVGGGMKPPLFLKAGDVVSLGIDGLGEQCQHVVQR